MPLPLSAEVVAAARASDLRALAALRQYLVAVGREAAKTLVPENADRDGVVNRIESGLWKRLTRLMWTTSSHEEISQKIAREAERMCMDHVVRKYLAKAVPATVSSRLVLQSYREDANQEIVATILSDLPDLVNAYAPHKGSFSKYVNATVRHEALGIFEAARRHTSLIAKLRVHVTSPTSPQSVIFSTWLESFGALSTMHRDVLLAEAADRGSESDAHHDRSTRPSCPRFIERPSTVDRESIGPVACEIPAATLDDVAVVESSVYAGAERSS